MPVSRNKPVSNKMNSFGRRKAQRKKDELERLIASRKAEFSKRITARLLKKEEKAYDETSSPTIE